MMSPLKDQVIESTVDLSNRRVVQILDAAAKCFAKKGFTETSVKDIAAKVGVTKSMVHYYFDSKAHLLHEVLAFYHQKHLQRVTDQMEVVGDSAQERARTSLKSLWKVIREEKRVFRLSLELWAISAHDAKLRERLKAHHERSRKLVTVGIEDSLGVDGEKLPFSTDALGALILAVLNGLAVQEYAEPDGVDMDETFRVFLAALLTSMSMLRMG